MPDVCGDEAVKQAEALLDDKDRQNLIDAIFPSDDVMPAPKKALSQAILELYARREAVSLGDASSRRLTSLFERLAERLAGQNQ